MNAEIVSKLLWCLNLVLSILLLSLVANARTDEDTRWEAGAMEGRNSDPKQRIYFYANYKERSETPLVWREG